MQKSTPIFALSLLSLACMTTSFAAKPINLAQQSPAFLNSTLSASSSIKELGRHVDLNQTTHIRVQQMYQGYPVWNGDALIHIPQSENVSLSQLTSASTMNGTMYQALAPDLAAASAVVFTKEQAQKALNAGISLHQKNSGSKIADSSIAKSTLMVYVDKNNLAHWAFYVSFLAGMKDGSPVVPTYILDAETLTPYSEWNDLQSLGTVSGGGFGGNPKMGRILYDGSTGSYPVLKVTRDALKNVCSLKNENVIVRDDTNSSGPFSNSPIATFNCNSTDPLHHNLYWDGEQDATNGGYSPVNDSLYIGAVIRDMYQKWYGVPVLSIFGFPAKLNMHAHAKDMSGKPMDNAFYLSLTMGMYFGDGVEMFYPLTSLGVGSHEISHGFTAQHANLTYEKQSGGLNESYSDMAAQAAEYYSTGTNNWQIGPEIVKGDGALRYMDDPTKDGHSIGNARDYDDSLNVHYTSGVFNKGFYLLATMPGWNTKQAFDVMVKANMDYWTANATFQDAACGVMKAAQDYHYPITDVATAMLGIGIDVSRC